MVCIENVALVKTFWKTETWNANNAWKLVCYSEFCI